MSANFEGMCMIEFYGDSCASCHAVMPVLSALAPRFGYKFIRVNAEDDGKLAEEYSITRVPTVILADGGREFARFSGYQPPEILEIWLEAKTEDYKKDAN